MSLTKIKTTCSGCSETVVVDRAKGTVTSRVASNGVRGSKHVPAHDVTAEIDGDDDDLVTWDCPRPSCGYADSYDLHA